MGDELALDFDHSHNVLVANLRDELTPDQIATLAAIDKRFEDLSRGGKDFNEAFWTDDGLKSSEDWRTIRMLAAQALYHFGWPQETPSAYRGEYVRAGSGLPEFGRDQ